MNNIEVKKTYPADFEKIYLLLQEFNSAHTREDWHKIFSYQWDGSEDYIGFHLEHNGNAVGFMGLIFSCRYKNNNRYKFCNITSWIVKENYRAATILLVRKLKSISDTIFTGLSPISESFKLLTLMGFSAFEKHYKIIPTVSRFLGRKSDIDSYEQLNLLDRVSGENRRIILDHAGLKCQSILFECNGKQCLLLYKIIKQAHYRVPIKKIQVFHISDIVLFNENFYAILKFFNRRFGLLSALYIDDRFIQSKLFLLSIKREINPPRICSPDYQNQIDIDALYSEAVLI